MKREDKNINSLVCYAEKYNHSTYTYYPNSNPTIFPKQYKSLFCQLETKGLANCRHDNQSSGTNLWSPEIEFKAEWDSG